MGFYSCVAKSSIGEATWNSWLKKRGKFIHQSPDLPEAFSKFALKNSQYLPSQYLPNAITTLVGMRMDGSESGSIHYDSS